MYPPESEVPAKVKCWSHSTRELGYSHQHDTLLDDLLCRSHANVEIG
jgi:hypothetical protein